MAWMDPLARIHCKVVLIIAAEHEPWTSESRLKHVRIVFEGDDEFLFTNLELTDNTYHGGKNLINELCGVEIIMISFP